MTRLAQIEIVTISKLMQRHRHFSLRRVVPSAIRIGWTATTTV
jgi:hypothetical protein